MKLSTLLYSSTGALVLRAPKKLVSNKLLTTTSAWLSVVLNWSDLLLNLQHMFNNTSAKTLFKHVSDQALKQVFPSDDLNTDFVLMLAQIYTATFCSFVVKAGHMGLAIGRQSKMMWNGFLVKVLCLINNVTHAKSEGSLCKCLQ